LNSDRAKHGGYYACSAGVPFEIMNTICPESGPHFSDLHSDPTGYRLDRDARLRQDSDDDDDDGEEDDEKHKDDDEDEDDGNNRNDGYSE
jgi:hypothetical protein